MSQSTEVLGGRKFLPGLKKFVKKAVRFTPQSMMIRALIRAAEGKRLFRGNVELLGAMTWEDVLKGAPLTWEKALSGETPELLGAFLPGLMKVVKKIGKFTAPITTKIAKSFLPSSIVDAAAKLDPSQKGNITPNAVAAVKSLIASKTAETPVIPAAPGSIQIQALTKTLTNPVFLAVAGAGVIAIIFLVKKRRR